MARNVFRSASILLCILVLAFAEAPQDTATIKVPVHLVSVPTLVVSKDGRFIPDLKAADF